MPESDVPGAARVPDSAKEMEKKVVEQKKEKDKKEEEKKNG